MYTGLATGHLTVKISQNISGKFFLRVNPLSESLPFISASLSANSQTFRRKLTFRSLDRRFLIGTRSLTFDHSQVNGNRGPGLIFVVHCLAHIRPSVSELERKQKRNETRKHSPIIFPNFTNREIERRHTFGLSLTWISGISSLPS